MLSTIERDLYKVNGMMAIGWKELPNYCGIPDIGYIWHNEWADPELEYKGKRVNAANVEMSMWEDYNIECEFLGTEPTDDGFAEYIRQNKEDVYELIELL